MKVTITVNGTTHESDVEPRTLLVQYVRETLKLQVCAIAALTDLLSYLAPDQASNTDMQAHFERVQAYRTRYGVAD